MSDRSGAAPISVVIPALNAAMRLPIALASLAPAALDGFISEVILSDGGSTDATRAIADAAGARIVDGPPGRGAQLRRGAAWARGQWLLFLHADTALSPAWTEDAQTVLANQETAGVFTLAFDNDKVAAKLVAAGAMMRTRIFAAPFGDQGLLISRSLYAAVGGYRDLPLMEDVEFIRRLVRLKGRRALRVLSSKAVTSAERYERDGYAGRVARNAWTLARYAAGASPEKLSKEYR